MARHRSIAYESAMRLVSVIRAAFRLLALGFIAAGPLPAAELSTDFPKPQPPLKLAPRLGRPFGDNAVFQQNMPVPIWGWTLPNAEVHVTFGDQKRATKAGADGRFEVKLDAMPADKLESVNAAPAGRTLSVVTRSHGKEETKVCSNILIGEVWLCSGQSNMAVRFGNTAYPKNSQSEAKYPALRFLGIEWTVSTPKTVGASYSVSFVFGRKLQSELLVPIGLMDAAVAGTGIEGWLYVPPGEEPIKTKYQNFIPQIEPLVGHAMRGALWYQGEANEKDGTWHWAEGKIEGSDLIVTSQEVAEPVAVRYAYTQFPAGCNLYNKDGLPASPFSSSGYCGAFAPV